MTGSVPGRARRGPGYSGYGWLRLRRVARLRHPVRARRGRAGCRAAEPVPEPVPEPAPEPAETAPGRRAAALLVALCVGLSGGACSLAGKIGGPAGGVTAAGDDGETDSDLISVLSSGAVTGDDVIAASAAAAALVGRGKGGRWENPRSGVRGTITPIASAAGEDTGCRGFLASYVNGPAEAWMEGEACRDGAGGWEVRSLRPWRR